MDNTLKSSLDNVSIVQNTDNNTSQFNTTEGFEKQEENKAEDSILAGDDRDLILLSTAGSKLLGYNEVKSFVLGAKNRAVSACTLRQMKVIDYLRELNGNSIITEPDLESGNWRTNIKSSLFFQKVIFISLYLRSLLKSSQENFISFSSENPILPSLYKKIFDIAASKTNFYEAIEKSLFYSVLSSYLSLEIKCDYVVNELGEVTQDVSVKPIHPLLCNFNEDKTITEVINYIPYEVAYKHNLVWDYPVEDLKPYYKTKEVDKVFYNVVSTDPSYSSSVKVSDVYCRYVSPDFVSSLYKFTIVNDIYLVSYSLVSDLDSGVPIIFESFYSDDVQVSFADLVWDYFKEDSRFLRGIIDRGVLSTASGFNLNTQALAEGENTITISPFTVVKSIGEKPAVSTFQLASFDPNLLPVRQLLVNEVQNITGMTEFLMGMPTSKGRPTAKEVSLKTQQNSEMISTIISRIESSFFVKAAKKMLALYCLYKFDDVKDLLNDNENQVLVEKMASSQEYTDTNKVLYSMLLDGISITVNGMTTLVKSQNEVQSIMEFVQLCSQLGLTPYIDMVTVFKELFKRMNLPSDFVRIPTQEEMVAMAQQQQAQQQKLQEVSAKVGNEVISDKDLLKTTLGNKNGNIFSSILQMVSGGQ
jgi:hypothetical protein